MENESKSKNRTRQILEENLERFRQVGLSKDREATFISLSEIDFRERLLPALVSMSKEQKISGEQTLRKLEEYMRLLVVMARLDLMPDITNNKAYILPKKGGLALQIGYKAYIEFANRSGWTFNVQVIYEKDEIDIDLATTAVRHKPSFVERKDSSIIGGYCIATNGSERVLEFMSKEEIDFVKNEASTDMIWKKWYGEMAKKTIIKRIIKRINISGTKLELVDAVDNSLGYDNSKSPVLVDQVMEVMSKDVELVVDTEIVKEDVAEEVQDGSRGL